MPRFYRGAINIDFTGGDGNQQNRLAAALRELGWIHVETSAFTCETPDLTLVWKGIGLVARFASSVGDLSALTFHIQGSDDFENGVPSTSTWSPANALNDISQMPFPGD